MKIEITCKTADSIEIDKLKNFQGNLKSISEAELNKLKKSIVDYGFSFPVFVWRNNILNGHQRIKAVRLLTDDGYTIDNIPVVKIDAKNKKEAAQKLLLENSKYASITQPGFDEFISEFEIDLSVFKDVLEIDNIDFFETGEQPDYEDEWDDMPEFDNDDQTSWKKIIVHFNSEKDMQEFAKIIGQKITEKTKFIYHPELEHKPYMDHEYTSDEHK